MLEPVDLAAQHRLADGHLEALLGRDEVPRVLASQSVNFRTMSAARSRWLTANQPAPRSTRLIAPASRS